MWSLRVACFLSRRGPNDGSTRGRRVGARRDQGLDHQRARCSVIHRLRHHRQLQKAQVSKKASSSLRSVSGVSLLTTWWEPCPASRFACACFYTCVVAAVGIRHHRSRATEADHAVVISLFVFWIPNPDLTRPSGAPVGRSCRPSVWSSPTSPTEKIGLAQGPARHRVA